MIEYTRQEISPAHKAARTAANTIVERTVPAQHAADTAAGRRVVVWPQTLADEVTAEVTRIIDEMLPDADNRDELIEHIVSAACRHAANTAAALSGVGPR